MTEQGHFDLLHGIISNIFLNNEKEQLADCLKIILCKIVDKISRQPDRRDIQMDTYKIDPTPKSEESNNVITPTDTPYSEQRERQLTYGERP